MENVLGIIVLEGKATELASGSQLKAIPQPPSNPPGNI